MLHCVPLVSTTTTGLQPTPSTTIPTDTTVTSTSTRLGTALEKKLCKSPNISLMDTSNPENEFESHNAYDGKGMS